MNKKITLNVEKKSQDIYIAAGFNNDAQKCVLLLSHISNTVKKCYKFVIIIQRPRCNRPDFFKNSYNNFKLLYEVTSALMHIIVC